MRFILAGFFITSLLSPSLVSSEAIKPISTASLTNIKKERRCGGHVAQIKLLCLHRHGKLDAVIAPTDKGKRAMVLYKTATVHLLHGASLPSPYHDDK